MLPDELDVQAVMDGTGLSRRTIGRYLADGTLAGYKAGKVWRIPRTALDEAVAAGRISWKDKAEQGSTNTDDVDWRTRALVAEAKLEATEAMVQRLDETLELMSAWASSRLNVEKAPEAKSNSTAIEVHEARRRRWPWQRRTTSKV